MKPFDASGAFAPPVPGGGAALRRMAVRSAVATVLSGGMALAIQIVATVVLGRLLKPADFGLVAMVTTFTLLLVNAPANGFIDSVLQRKEMTHRLASTLFWINIVFSLLLTAVFAASGPLLARFFGEAAVSRISVAMSASIFLAAAPTVHSAILRKAMRFRALAMNDIIARAVGVLTSVSFGIAGYEYWALVLGACALPLSTCIGIWILCPWVPGPPRRGVGARSTLRFAGQIGVRYSINYAARNLDNLLVGWRFGAYALGFYKKAYDLFTLSVTQLVSSNANVAVSALSRVREDRKQYLKSVLGAINVMALIGMGLAATLTLIGKDLIRVLLGPGWEQAGVIFTFFAPAIGIMMVNGIHGWLHVSLGHADRWLRWGILEWVVTCGLFVAGLRWGPEGIAVAWGVSFWVLTLPAIAYAGKPINLGAFRVLGAIWRYVVAALLAGVAAFAILLRLRPLQTAPGVGGAALRIACVTVLFGALYMVGVVAFHGSTTPLGRVVRLVRELRGAKAQRGAAMAAAANSTSG